jgi:2-polyprenyl-3-methyl-5-hydroxy-6-metoxy-1,4-benzoquinol methylase
VTTDSGESRGISQYFEGFRNDVIAVVPDSAERVLSVGCAAGTTDAELVKRGVKVVGIEIDSKAAETVRQRGLVVLEGDASEVDISQINEPFNCLIYADILEHLPEPTEVLNRHVNNSSPRSQARMTPEIKILYL